MRTRFGLPPLEARIGAAAQDFALAAAAPEVLLTRALRVDGAPSVPARFLSRLETLLAGSGLPSCRAAPPHPGAVGPGTRWTGPKPYRAVATARAAPAGACAAARLSVTAIELWMRDPYALYAQRILKLRPLDPLDADPGAAERGSIVHHALDLFVRRHPDSVARPTLWPHCWRRGARLSARFWDIRRLRPSGGPGSSGWPPGSSAFEQARRRDGTRPIATEISGGIDVEPAGALFRLTAKADRIDRLGDGRLAIIDYKTGRPPSADLVRRGLAPQLPLEAIIADQGGFPNIPAAVTGELAYLRLSGGNPPGEFLPALGEGGAGRGHRGCLGRAGQIDRRIR